MKIIVNNEDGVEETIDASVVRLEKDDVIVMKRPNIPPHDLDRRISKIREFFPDNNILLVEDMEDFAIVKNPTIMEESDETV